MPRNSPRFKRRIALAVLAIGAVLPLVIALLPMFVGAMATALHPEPQRAPSVAHSDPAPQWSDAVNRARQIMRTALAAQNLPGLSVAVGVGGDVVWAEGFGWSSIEDHAPVTPKTRFRIGSTSEALTSAAMGALLEQKRLDLDDEIQTYVPEFPKKRWPVALRQVMGHVGGLPTDDERTLDRQRCERPVEALPAFADRELLFEPGTEYRYSNYGWILASVAIEAAADRPFLTFMRNQIFAPLGMNDTGAESTKQENPLHLGEPGEDAPFLTLFDHLVLRRLGVSGRKPKATSRDAPAWATVYTSGWGPEPFFRHGVHVKHSRNLSCYAGARAFFSTPSDLVRFGLAIDSGTVLQPATVQLLQASQPLRSGRKTRSGLGWDRETVTLGGAPTEAIGRNGDPSGGKAVSFLIFGKQRVVVAVMSNISHADTSDLATKVAEAFTGRN